MKTDVSKKMFSGFRCEACVFSIFHPGLWPEPVGSGQNAEQIISISGSAEVMGRAGEGWDDWFFSWDDWDDWCDVGDG